VNVIVSCVFIFCICEFFEFVNSMGGVLDSKTDFNVFVIIV
jgi:hypothetical protein